ncbi:plastocyanin/azurin family copper-binding protein [Haliscomenobacter hydrossis]|uniref:Blue (Type 1) copper domain protein n=1 Tax=Haliscomenobacter hydrossis (strain ATCC 27775 / DSM 1100 / LMG 10767 / O) TaxID=760192 RepID=F4L3I5_HALH1|nr:plastocyanin/azurin family copper-binding protein [Haliscomenobacter hydrossis]AEE52962.1 blue (type 1) copper domain protein [Haliscomenobacter hydrossis DSM 1100]
MKTLNIFCALYFCCAAFVTIAQSGKALTESDYYFLKTVAIPEDIKLEVGGLAPLADGRLAVATRRGEIWMIENPYMLNGTQPHYQLYAEGLHEVLGLAYKDGSLYCTQRGELTKMTDTDGDGRADVFEPIYRFDLSGNYHEYAYGPVFDSKGDMYVTLNVAWVGYGDGLGKWHGWLLKIKPDGQMEPIATGLRSPAGFLVNSKDEVFYAENQGDWVGSGRVTHLEKGDFAGNAGGLNWTQDPKSPLRLTKADLAKVDDGRTMYDAAKVIKEMKLPCVWFPHTLMGISTSDIIEDNTGGSFGPFNGQYFVADQGHSKVMRMTLEKVNGEYQGACYPFREGWASGLLRLRWGTDASMWGGMTSRGWSSTGKADYALQRLVWSGKTPFEMKNISARADGFEIEFTLPVDKNAAKVAANYGFTSFNYKYQHQYGSPIINQGNCPLRGIIVSEDGLKVRVVLDSIREGYIHELKLKNFKAANGTPLLHDFAYYTMNSVPTGEKATLSAEQKVSVTPAGNPMNHEHMAMTKPPVVNDTKKGKKASKATATTALSKNLNEMPANWGQPDVVLSLGTKPGLKYDQDLLSIKAGSKVKLVFNNNDDMQHNLVVTMPGMANKVGEKGMALGLKGPEMHYVPNLGDVIAHSKILEPGTTETIYFTAPTKPGDYQFVCTYPGHYLVMQGILKVLP